MGPRVDSASELAKTTKVSRAYFSNQHETRETFSRSSKVALFVASAGSVLQPHQLRRGFNHLGKGKAPSGGNDNDADGSGGGPGG